VLYEVDLRAGRTRESVCGGDGYAGEPDDGRIGRQELGAGPSPSSLQIRRWWQRQRTGLRLGGGLRNAPGT
jgi:hypothetical protein